MYLFFDTETTGLPKNWNAPVTDTKNWPRMVQIAWILYDENGLELGRNDHIVKPDNYTIPRSTSQIHGITTERAIEEGVDLQMVLDEFVGQIKETTILVAHNISFDEKILGAEYLRSKMGNPLVKLEKICTMRGTTDYVKIRNKRGYKWPNLSELHIKLFGRDFEDAHDAAADIDATAKCFWEARRLDIL